MAKPVCTATNPNDAAPLAYAALPVASVALTGAAVDPDAGAIVSWQWVLIYKPAGSVASIASATSQNTTLDNVDVWGNYILLLTCVDDQAEESETDFTKAPSSAITVVRVNGPTVRIQKIGDGERNHGNALRQWAEELDLVGYTLENQAIESGHGTLATSANLDSLTQNAYATDDETSTGTDLHKHPGKAIDKATTTLTGVTVLAEAPVDVGNPKTPTRDRFKFTGHVSGAVAAIGAGDPSQAQAFWKVEEEITVVDFGITFRKGGTIAGTHTIKLYDGSWTNVEANDFASMTELASVDVVQGATLDRPTEESVTGLSATVASGRFLCVRVTAVPASPGEGMTWTVGGQKRW